jgi:hypothetical protein
MTVPMSIKIIFTHPTSHLTFRGPCIVIYSYNETNLEYYKNVNNTRGHEIKKVAAAALHRVASTARQTFPPLSVIMSIQGNEVVYGVDCSTFDLIYCDLLFHLSFLFNGASKC